IRRTDTRFLPRRSALSSPRRIGNARNPLGVDPERLPSLPRVPGLRELPSRIQLEIHGEPVRPSRRKLRDAERPLPTDLPKLLRTFHAMAIRRLSTCKESFMNFQPT